LEGLLQEKVNSLSTILGSINQEIEHRKLLSGKLIYRIYQQYMYLKSYFLMFDHGEIGRNRSVELRRTRIEQQLNQLLQEKRMEQGRCFRDIALLNKELRNWFKEYANLTQRVKLVLNS